ncbi:poly alpha-glucosyltransferase [Acinetobacter gyllenbergii]|uniref:poly alpha-glucosyltransferase n=1 Tax=Acinetobacter gyllenbergii TaxID=134534 RepID=UPI0021D1311B|nr:poly alpha-glucosyltransferase [Acinetobacter gyllenbergii]MCU4582446.1 poly alpha-glucosyltransferase [Acinetobacter gyllenbergii]
MSITTISALEQLTHLLSEHFFKQIQPHIDVSKAVIFCSYGEHTQRCQVWNSSCSDFADIQMQLFNFLEQHIAGTEKLPTFLKFDVAFNIQQENWQNLEQTLKNQFHNNHYRKGISFDADFNCCFLEQELYGRAIIRALSYNSPNFLDEKNLNKSLLRKYPNQQHRIKIEQLQQLWTFDTLAVIYEAGQLIPLHSQFTENGVRYLLEPKKQHFKKMIKENAKFLHQQIQRDGRFAYGFFPAYDREIRSYNTVRHCTSVYALLETLAIQSHQADIEKIQLAIDYALQHFYIEKQTKLAYMLDGNEATGLDEIKLGANAAAILMLSKYQEVTGDDRYLVYAQALANGILSMINDAGETTHVLHYPSYEIKEKFRIIYYDGEAALALLRLYQLHADPKLLQTVKCMFERFIEKKYDRYHDHWLSYCSNELTKICPEEKYFQFGLNNYLRHLVFIRNRKTAYATLLEMMMAAYQMVLRLRALGLGDLFEKAQFDDLKKLIEFRAEFQRTGFFYPEVAMYMALPDKVLNAFYVRHDRFRVRIDDQEHNLSGYVAYVQHFETEA